MSASQPFAAPPPREVLFEFARVPEDDPKALILMHGLLFDATSWSGGYSALLARATRSVHEAARLGDIYVHQFGEPLGKLAMPGWVIDLCRLGVGVTREGDEPVRLPMTLTAQQTARYAPRPGSVRLRLAIAGCDHLGTELAGRHSDPPPPRWLLFTLDLAGQQAVGVEEIALSMQDASAASAASGGLPGSDSDEVASKGYFSAGYTTAGDDAQGALAPAAGAGVPAGPDGSLVQPLMAQWREPPREPAVRAAVWRLQAYDLMKTQRAYSVDWWDQLALALEAL